MKKNNYLVVLCLLFLVSCATVKFYDSQGNDLGIRVYSAKPYLLVTKNQKNDKTTSKSSSQIVTQDSTVAISIIYLPDLRNPQFAKIKTGIGSSELSLTLANGILTSYGLKSDTKIPETITSATGLITSLASAITSLGTKSDTSIGEKLFVNELQSKKEIDFGLYEINMDGGTTKLKKVVIEK
jgi:hypothetical protein